MSSAAPQNIEPHEVELVLSQIEALPALSPVVAKVLSLTLDNKSHSQQLIDAVSSDAALSARIISIMKRAQQGMRSDRIDIAGAVAMLGFDTVRQVTLACKVMEVFGPVDTRREDGEFDRVEFWKHCLGTACVARRIAKAISGGPPPEEAFVFGLLHDIGKIALDASLPKSFARIVRKANQSRCDIAEVERAFLGIDHCAVGHRLANRWGLPARLTECIWLHHQMPEALPASVATGKHVQIVQLADTLVREQHIGYSGNHSITTSSRDLAARLGLPESERQAILQSIGEEIAARAAWIGISDVSGRDVYLQALVKTAEEVTTANATLSAQNKNLLRKTEYFTALRELNQSVSPHMPVREVCAAGAAIIRQALDVSSVLVFMDEAAGRWVEVGLYDGERTISIERPPPEIERAIDEALAAVELARGGTWLAPSGAGWQWLIERYSHRLGDGIRWLFPIIRERQWIGGALIACTPAKAASLRGETSELEALSAAVGLALAQAQAQHEAIVLSDELAEVNRRWSATQAELLKAKTAETVMAMAAGAAHELNTPLAVISGRAQILKRKAQSEEDRDALDAIARQAHLCSDIVTEVMEFSQPVHSKPERIGVGEFLEAFRADCAASGLLESSALELEIASGISAVWFDRALLTRVFRELVQNAVEASESLTRRLTIKARNHLTEEWVVVNVVDNGRGMTSDVLERAMDPFYSHRTAGRGRGLGLARVARWLQAGGGSIRIQSEPGRGTDVELKLPIAAAGIA